MALDAHKGRSYEAEKLKKQAKSAEKKKQNKKAKTNGHVGVEVGAGKKKKGDRVHMQIQDNKV